jgi:hypothetical protein
MDTVLVQKATGHSPPIFFPINRSARDKLKQSRKVKGEICRKTCQRCFPYRTFKAMMQSAPALLCIFLERLAVANPLTLIIFGRQAIYRAKPACG